MNLIIDIGNTIVKYALFRNDNLVALTRSNEFEMDVLKDFFEQYSIMHSISCSVRVQDKKLDDWISERSSYRVLTEKTPVPIRNNYSSPETLGYDRLASVVGAHEKYPNAPVLCIDIGTCITYDFIDSKGVYYGGGISPGLDLRFRAMNNFTQKLPLVSLESPMKIVPLIGTTTEDSMRSGVVNGIASEIDGMIARYKERNQDLKVILTGGDSGFFESYLKSKIFAFPNLVLHGLNTILQYNAN